MPHRAWLSAILGSLLALPHFPAAVAAQEPNAAALVKLRDHVVKQEEKLLATKAAVGALQFERDTLAACAKLPEALIASEGPRFRTLLDSVLKRLGEKHQVRMKALNDLLEGKDGLRAESEAALQAWREARLAELATIDNVLAEEQRLRLNLEDGAAWPLWDEGMTWVALCGGLLTFVGVLLALHEGRRGLRRRLRFHGRMGAAAVLALTAMGCDGQPATPPAGSARLVKHRDELQKLAEKRHAEQANLAAEVDKHKEQEVEKAWNAAVSSWAKLLEPVAQNKEPRKGKFYAFEKEARAQVRAVLTAAFLVELAAKEHAAAVKGLRAEQERLGNRVAHARWHFLMQSGARVGMCLGFVYLGFLPLRRVRMRLRRERQREYEQCPLCLAEGKGSLTVEDSPVQDDRYPEPQQVRCSACDYRFRASYRKLPRFCFPTVGVYTSGKTHWLVTAYDLIKNNNVPAPAIFKKAPSLADDDFDRFIESILKEHQGARATVQHGNNLPYPLMFHVEDADRYGASAALLNLFDFSGELMDQRIDEYTLRRRALLMDGFVLFLDPTQVHGKGKSAGIDYQNRVLSQFHEEMRDLRGLDVGARLRVPVAVCISKLDLLTIANPLGSQAVSWLRSLRATTRDPVTLKILRQRSRLCEQILPIMFPGWNIKKTLRESFGDRFLFFPMTPISLEESELGVTDLAQRTFAPFGVLEPILWLLHMHGYCMLD